MPRPRLALELPQTFSERYPDWSSVNRPPSAPRGHAFRAGSLRFQSLRPGIGARCCQANTRRPKAGRVSTVLRPERSPTLVNAAGVTPGTVFDLPTQRAV